MSNDESGRIREHARQGFLKRWSVTKRLADHVLNGPRAIMLPSEIHGERIWLEPVLRMTATLFAPLDVHTKSVYSVPRYLHEEYAKKLILLRASHWRGESDRQRCRLGWIEKRDLRITYSILTEDHVSVIHKLLCGLDQALGSFPFAVEGLIVDNSKPLESASHESLSRVGLLHAKLLRTTRFQRIELAWPQNTEEPTILDRDWKRLWDELVLVQANEGLTTQSIEEKYDIDPSLYAELLLKGDLPEGNRVEAHGAPGHRAGSPQESPPGAPTDPDMPN